MTTREKGELILIAVATGACAAFRSRLPVTLASGDLVLCASVLLLAQGLLRDLWIKYVVRKTAVHTGPARPLCMCMESTVGVLGVLAGLLLIFVKASSPWHLPGWFWPALVCAVCVVGFLIKDLVLDWKTWRIRREKDHQSIVFW